jgi:hypothetical protein
LLSEECATASDGRQMRRSPRKEQFQFWNWKSTKRKSASGALDLHLRNGARGRSRTDTLLRAVDFLPTSAFAAAIQKNSVRGLEHAFTLVL